MNLKEIIKMEEKVKAQKNFKKFIENKKGHRNKSSDKK